MREVQGALRTLKVTCESCLGRQRARERARYASLRPCAAPSPDLQCSTHYFASVVAQKAGLVAGFGPMHTVRIPVAEEPRGRFHLATSPIFYADAHELRYVNQKFPIAESQMFGDAKLKRVHVSQGATKSYRIPQEAMHVDGDVIAWYCVGDEEPIEGCSLRDTPGEEAWGGTRGSCSVAGGADGGVSDGQRGGPRDHCRSTGLV